MASVPNQSSLRGGARSTHRLLDTTEYTDAEIKYLAECQSTFLGESIISDGLITQQEFAGSYDSLCMEYSSASNCGTGEFSSLASSLQNIFFEGVCSPMQDPAKCANDLITIGGINFGYIVSKEIMPEVQVHIADLCVEMKDLVFFDFAGEIKDLPFEDYNPIHSEYVSNESDEIGNTETVVAVPPVPPAAEPLPEKVTPGSLDLTTLDSSIDSWFNFNEPSNNTFSNGPIVGIAVAAGACLIFFGVIALRRRQLDDDSQSGESGKNEKSHGGLAKQQKKPSTSGGFRGQAPEEVAPPSRFQAESLSVSDASLSTASSRLSYTSDIDVKTTNLVMQVEDAIVEADWDTVYKLASELAEKEEVSLPAGSQPKYDENRNWRRRNLSGEDMARAEALDDLIMNGDWTCVAVTAALYAGESGVKSTGSVGSTRRVETALVQSTSDNNAISNQESLLSLKKSMDQAVDAGNWDQVLKLSSQVENSKAYQSRPSSEEATEKSQLVTDSGSEGLGSTLTQELDSAIKRGDWQLVGVYADRMKDPSHRVTTTESTSQAIVPAVKPQSPYSNEVTDLVAADMNKQTTIQRLAVAGKWNGVKIMAGLYEMETKGSLV